MNFFQDILTDLNNDVRFSMNNAKKLRSIELINLRLD